MPVASYILYCMPAMRPRVEGQLRRDPRVTLGPARDVRIPLVTQTTTHEEAVALDEILQEIPGVRRAVLIYHNFEDIHVQADEPPTPAAS